MIIFAELQMQGDKHVHVNSGLLNIIVSTFNNQDVVVFSDSKHKYELLKYVKCNKGLKFITFQYTGLKELRKSATIAKVIRESYLACKIFLAAKKNKSEVVIFASAFPFTALVLNFFSWLFNQRTIIAFHGDIGVLNLKRNKITTIIFKYVIKLFFRTRQDNLFALFYGKTIAEELFRAFPSFNSRNIITIDHPYNYDSKLVIDDSGKDNSIVIANIGTGLMNKNSHLLYQLAEVQKHNIDGNKVKFIQVGNVSEDVMSFSNEYVDILNSNEFIPFDVFERNLMKADYFIYFFKKSSYYDFCPSGTFFDAIKYRKPIISLRNPFFEYYFNELGNIGYLCNTVEEMNELINQILLQSDDLYNEQVLALTEAVEKLSIQNIQRSFHEQFSTLSWSL